MRIKHPNLLQTHDYFNLGHPKAWMRDVPFQVQFGGGFIQELPCLEQLRMRIAAFLDQPEQRWTPPSRHALGNSPVAANAVVMRMD